MAFREYPGCPVPVASLTDAEGNMAFFTIRVGGKPFIFAVYKDGVIYEQVGGVVTAHDPKTLTHNACNTAIKVSGTEL